MRRADLAAFAGVSIVGPFLACGFFFGLNYLALGVDPELVAEKVRAGFEEGQLSYQRTTANSALGGHPWADCETLTFLVVRPERRLRMAISGAKLHSQAGGHPCERLGNFVYGRASADGSFFFHRYWNGHRALAGLALRWTSVEGLRNLSRYATYIGLAVLFLLPAVALASTRNRAAPAETRFRIAFLALVLGLYLFFAIPYYAPTFSHSPSHLVLFGFLALAFAVNLHRVRLVTALAIACGFGCLTAYFEYLIGATPLGLGAIIAVLALQPKHAANPRAVIERAALMCACFSAALVACFAIKQVVATLAFYGEAWSQFFASLFHRIGGSDYPAGESFERLLRSSAQLAWGSDSVGRSLFVLSPLLFLGAYLFARRRCRLTNETLAVDMLLGSALVIPLWYAVFWQHTTQHASFMIRIVAWPLSLALAAIAFGAATRAVRPIS